MACCMSDIKSICSKATAERHRLNHTGGRVPRTGGSRVRTLMCSDGALAGLRGVPVRYCVWVVHKLS